MSTSNNAHNHATHLHAPELGTDKVDRAELRCGQVDALERRAGQVDALEPRFTEILTKEVSHAATVTSDPPVSEGRRVGPGSERARP
jgi:hypothetical protein